MWSECCYPALIKGMNMVTKYYLKNMINNRLTHFNGYAVDSEIVTGLTYLSDGQNHGLLRAKEAMTWPKEEDNQVIGRMVPEVRREAAEVFEMARRWERCGY